MKYLKIILFLGLLSCKAPKYAVPHIDVIKITEEYLRSKTMNDTFIVYYELCGGMCITGFEQKIFVIEKKGEYALLTKFSNYCNSKPTEVYFPWKYLKSSFQEIESDELVYDIITDLGNETFRVESGDLSDGKLEKVAINFGEKKIGYRIRSIPLDTNEFKKRTILLDKIKSILYERNFENSGYKYKKHK